MIDYQKSAEMNGMLVDELKAKFDRFPSSNRKVWRICDVCGEGMELMWFQCSNLCHVCACKTKEYRESMAEIKMDHDVSRNTREMQSKSGKGVWNKMTPEEIKERSILMSCGVCGIMRDEWRGFVGNNQSHLKSIDQCDQINERFKGSDAHHLTPSIVVFIPTELHRHISHSLRTGRNMKEINTLAFQFLMGEL